MIVNRGKTCTLGCRHGLIKRDLLAGDRRRLTLGITMKKARRARISRYSPANTYPVQSEGRCREDNHH